MSAIPLFAETLDALKLSLRLTDATLAGADEVIDACIDKARLRFVSELGKQRILYIQSIMFDPNALAEPEIIRMRAVACERSLVKYHLMQDMPVLFVSSSAAAQELFNTEPLRDPGMAKMNDDLRRLDTYILTELAYLRGDSDDAPTSVQSFVIGPDEPNPAPGGDVWPRS